LKTEVTNEIFSDIMAKAFKTREIYPNMDTEILAKMACSEYQDHDDFDLIVFQVVMNLVNANR
jgi:hypothetical protein